MKKNSIIFIVLGIILSQNIQAQEVSNEEVSLEIKDIVEVRNDDDQILENEESFPVITSISDGKENAGTQTIMLKGTTDTLSGEFFINESGEISNGKENSNKIMIENGEIISIDRGLVRTNGGVNDTDIMYTSVEDAANRINPIPISGGAFEGLFKEVISYENNDYVKFQISGLDAVMPLSEVTLIPSNLVKAVSYYQENNGEWIFFEAIDSLTSEEYTSYYMGDAPSWAKEGTKYYTFDDTNYSENIYTTSYAKLTNESYFQNLPFNSTSVYSGSDYKKYLEKQGMTGSKYYTATNAFVEAQDKENVNSLLLFAFANHESYYGTSTYSKRCYNFFGRGAYDSNPDNACIEFGYNTARDGILSQAKFLQNSYFDIMDYRYAGTHFGNKSSGMNVYYASDVNWGKKNASHANMIDNYLGKKDNGKYRIAKIKKDKLVYKNSALTEILKINIYDPGDGSCSNGKCRKDYYLGAMTGSGSEFGDNIIIREDKSSSYAVQLPTPINNSTSNTCTYIQAKKGSYPNYEGTSKQNVPSGEANFACDYGKWNSQVGYITKSDVVILNDVTAKPPTEVDPYTYKYEYYSNGKVKYKFKISSSGYIVNATEYEQDGNKTRYFEYLPNTMYGKEHSKRIKYIFEVNSSSKIGFAKELINGSTVRYFEYTDETYYGKGHGEKIRNIFYIQNNYIAYTEGYSNGNLVNIYEYQNSTKYGGHGSKIKYKFYVNSSKIIKKTEKYISGKITNVYEYYSGTKYGYEHGNKIKYEFYLRSNREIIRAEEKKGNKLVKIYEYNPKTIYGSGHGKKIRYQFFIDTKGYISYALGYRNGILTEKYLYQKNTKYGNHSSKITKIIKY